MKPVGFTLMSVLLFATAAPVTAAAPDAKIPPIKEIKGPKPALRTFKESSAKKPLVIRTEKVAALYFGRDDVKTLKSVVDFKQQVLLVFAWRGSGKDKLSYTVAESYPEQITFRYKRGRTRDLRPHVRIFVLRSNVKWSTK